MSGLGMSIYEKGQKQGIQQEIQQGEDKAFMIMQKLLDAGRYEDARRATTDSAYKNQLMKEFAL